MDDNIATSDRHPLFPFPTPKPSRRLCLLTSLIHVVIRSFDAPNPATTAWRDFCTDTLFWIMTASAKLSETLRSRSIICGTSDVTGQAGEVGSTVAKQQLTVFQDMLAIISRPNVFPYHIGERAAFILALAVEDRLHLGSPDTDMELDDGTRSVIESIDKALCGFLKIIKTQRAGRAGGSTWLKLLAIVETHLTVQEGTSANVSRQDKCWHTIHLLIRAAPGFVLAKHLSNP